MKYFTLFIAPKYEFHRVSFGVTKSLPSYFFIVSDDLLLLDCLFQMDLSFESTDSKMFKKPRSVILLISAVASKLIEWQTHRLWGGRLYAEPTEASELEFRIFVIGKKAISSSSPESLRFSDSLHDSSRSSE
jgi:hypothetical protein